MYLKLHINIRPRVRGLSFLSRSDTDSLTAWKVYRNYAKIQRLRQAFIFKVEKLLEGVLKLAEESHISSDKEEQKNHEVYNMVSISEFAHRGPHGSFYGQAVRSTILVGTTESGTSRIRALWTAVSSPLIHHPFKTTWLVF